MDISRPMPTMRRVGSLVRGRSAFSRSVKPVMASLAGLALLIPTPAAAQGNDDDRTPLGSRIKRDRQFPTDLPPRRFEPTAVNRARSKMMLHQFSGCIYNRSRAGSLDLLKKTDFGFVSFQQIKLSNERALKIYGFSDCLSQVARANSADVRLSWSPGALRQWLIQEAYFDRYRDAPDWAKPGNVIDERTYVFSEQNASVRMPLDFADCVVASDPNNADLYFRTASGSPEEKQALQGLIPVLGPCLPAGIRLEVQPVLLRIWLGEALWHAANHSGPAAVKISEAAQ